MKVEHNATVFCVPLFDFISYLMPTVRYLTRLQMMQWFLCSWLS